MEIWLFLTFNPKKARMPRIFSWTFLWMFCHHYSPLTVSECIVSTVVMLTFGEGVSEFATRTLDSMFLQMFFHPFGLIIGVVGFFPSCKVFA